MASNGLDGDVAVVTGAIAFAATMDAPATASEIDVYRQDKFAHF